QRPPQSQWTVSGAGSVLLAGAAGPAAGEAGVMITAATPGRVVDYDVTDPYDMGSAMAPAAVDTIAAHFRDTCRDPGDVDLILTGDLGRLGRRLALDLASGVGLQLDESRFLDTGLLIYAGDQEVDSGGSGCACSAVVFCGHIWRLLKEREIREVLLVGTGALHSPIACKQGESIPGLAHAILIEVDDAS
ncbi:MAG: stage V sporulation protein AD, partial [Bacillota bacterium]